MSRIRSRDLIALARANAERQQTVAERLPAALSRVLDWTPSGVSNGTGPSVSGGDVTGLDSKLDDRDRWRGRSDRHAAYVQAIQTDLRTIDRITTGLEATLRKLDVLDLDAAQKLAAAAEASSYQCANPACGAWVEGTAEDRLRDHRCEACYRWRKNHGGIEDRPHRLVHRQPVEGCPVCHVGVHPSAVDGCSECRRIAAPVAS